MEILDLIRVAIEKNASDLHLTVGLPPMMRIHGKLMAVETDAISANDAETLISKMLNEEQKIKLEQARSIDFTYSYIEVHCD